MSRIAIPSWVPTTSGASPLSLTPRVKIPDALQRACIAAKTAVDNKGHDVLVLDMRGLTPMFDYFVISTAGSRRQVHTIVEETDATLRAVGDARMGVEGYEASKWVVQDYGDVIVHVFDADTREYYKLEELWADAKKVDWQGEILAGPDEEDEEEIDEDEDDDEDDADIDMDDDEDEEDDDEE